MMAATDALQSFEEEQSSELDDKTTVNEAHLFDDLMKSVGDDGLFQKRLNVIFNVVFVVILTMPLLNLVMIMSVPMHHCHVPGRDAQLYSLKQWQEKMLPKIPGDINDALEPCKMFLNGSEIGSCTSGVDFDKTWYQSTAPSDNNWVCDKELYVTNTFVVSRIGEITGTFIFGQLGDTIGRKPVYFITLVLMVLGRSLLTVTSHSYPLFLAMVFLGNASTGCVFQTPLVVGMEISSESKRSSIAFIQCLAWVAGYCALPLLQWAIGDWKVLVLGTTLPGLLALLLYPLLPESPRWLASRGKVKEAGKVLKYIATVNGNQVPDNMYQVLEKIKTKKEKTYGVASVFSSIRLARNTVMITICWIVSGLSFYALFLNTHRMPGNPFMNFFWQALAELPSYVAGQYLSNRLGRRWTHTASYVMVVLLAVLILITYGMASWILTSLITGVKFAFTLSFYIVWLQGMEIYPTCVRQTGTSVGGLISSIFGMLGPYIVYLGKTVDERLPYVILLCLASIGVVCSATLPETLDKKLPETLEDARNFGQDQRFWSLNLSEKKNKKCCGSK